MPLTYDSTRYQGPISRPASIRINGRDLRSFGLQLQGLPNLMFPPVRQRHQQIDGFPGAIDYGGEYDIWPFTVSLQLWGRDHEDGVDKLDRFKRWLDLEQHRSQEWVIDSKAVKALQFELAANQYWYNVGTITVSTGTATVTGTGTQFKKFLKPGGLIEFATDSTRYYIESIQSDTQLTLTANVPATLTDVVYRAERRRFLLVNLDSNSSISEVNMGGMNNSGLVGKDKFASSAIRSITIGLVAVHPYWLGEQFEHIEKDVATGSFAELFGLGTVGLNPNYIVEGAAQNPQITSGPDGLLAYTLIPTPTVRGRNVENKTDLTFTNLTSQSIRDSTQTNLYGASLPIFGNRVGSSGDTVTFESLFGVTFPSTVIDPNVFSCFNRRHGTLRFLVKPEFSETTNRDHVLFHDGATTNPFVIKYDSTNSRWSFSTQTDEVTDAVYYDANHQAGNWLSVVVTWDGNAPAKQIYVDGVAGTGGTGACDVDVAASNCQIGYDSGNHRTFNGYLEEVALWDIELASADVLDLNTKRAYLVSDSNGNSLVNVLLGYWNVNGISTHGTISDNTNLGMTRLNTLPVTATTLGDVVTVPGGGPDIFIDNDRVVVWDDTGYKSEGRVNGTPTAGSISLYNAIGDTERIGVCARLASGTYFQKTSPSVHIDWTTEYAVSAWIRTTSTVVGYVFEKRGTDDEGVLLSIDAAGLVTATLTNALGGVYMQSSSTAVVNDGRWHHIALIYTDGTPNLSVYVDGYQSGTADTSTNGDKDTGSGNLTIGARTSGDIFVGDIRDVAIWITTITNLDIVKLARSPIDGPVTVGSTAGHWKMTDGAWRGVLSDSIQSNDLSFVGGDTTDYSTHSRAQYAYISTNLLGDPDTDSSSNSIGGWVISAGSTLTKDTTTSYRNPRSLKLDAGVNDELARQTINVLAGENYVFSIQTKSSVAGHRVGYLVYSIQGAVNIAGHPLPNGDNEYLNDTNWNLRETCFKIPVGTTTIQVSGAVETTGETGYFDDFRVEKNVIDNGGMEDATAGLADGWTNPDSGTPADETGTNLHSGARSQKYTKSADSTYEGIVQSVTLPRTDCWYRVNVWARGESGGETLTVNHNNFTGSGYSGVLNTFTLTTSYKQYSLLFSVATDVAGDIEIKINDSNGIFYVDDVSLVQLTSMDLVHTAQSTNTIYEHGINGYGILPTGGDHLYYDDIPGNRNQGSVIARIRPQFQSNVDTGDTTDHYLFSWSDSATDPTQNGVAVFFDSGSQSFAINLYNAGVYSTSNNLKTGTPTHKGTHVFAEDESIELAIWWNQAGIVDDKDGLTYYLKILVNGTVIYSETSALTANIPAINMKHLWIGSDGISATTSGSVGNFLIEKFALYCEYLSDEELVGYATDPDPIVNQNATLVYSGTLAVGDQYTFNGNTQDSEIHDVSAGTIAPQHSQTTGYVPSLRGNEEDESTLLYVKSDSATVKQLTVQYHPRFR